MPSRYGNFFEAFRTCMGPREIVVTAATPREMLVKPPGPVGSWAEWVLLPCSVAFDKQFADLESLINQKFPSSFKAWYTSYFTLDMDLAVVRLPANPSNAPLAPLHELLIRTGGVHSPPMALGLLPFGSEALMDAGPLCFDTRAGADPDSWPVTYWDHDAALMLQSIGPHIFSSFDKLIECCTAYMKCFAEIMRRDPSGSRNWVRQRGPCISEMMRLDPAGAGGPGRSYWDDWAH